VFLDLRGFLNFVNNFGNLENFLYFLTVISFLFWYEIKLLCCCTMSVLLLSYVYYVRIAVYVLIAVLL
jgi:hypothetical protein